VGILSLALGCSQGLADSGEFEVIEAELVDRAVVMKLPDGVRRVRMRVLNEDGVWETCTIAHLNGSEGYLKLRLPDGVEMADVEVAASWTDPFPFEFYQGDSAFEPTEGDGGGGRNGGVVPTGFEDANSDSATVEESDIWKWRDQTLYFFNQYRGLQVVDVSDPSSPERVAGLRIPFSGEQLYLHPSLPTVILLTYDQRTSNGQVLLVEHSEADELTEQNSVPIPGYILESRMVGSILYVVSRQTWQNSVVDPDTGTEHVEWESGLNVSKIDLTDPANPIIAAPLELRNGRYNYWGAQVQATSETLLVSTNTYDSVRRQTISTVHVIDISDPAEDPSLTHHVSIAGQVQDKFSMQIKDDVLTVVSQVWRWQEARQRWASVETFDLSEAPEEVEETLAQLQFANDESITATRFSGELLYVVTVLQIDPLFIIDLTDPSDPQLLGELEVPGFSTHLEPYGDGGLISVGVEGPQLAVSWFDVSNQAEPTLKSRVYVGDENGWSWSEANWDEKAFGYFPNDNLILLPYQGSVPEVGWVNGIQIIEIGEDALLKRGSIEHEFQARRARVVEDAVVSISGQSLKSLDITDPDNPALLSELILAWPADFVFRIGDHLAQIERGQNYGYYGGGSSNARLHISSVEDPDDRLSFLDLPAGTVVGARLEDSSLHLAQTEVEWMEYEDGERENVQRFTASVVDLSEPLSPVLRGSDTLSRKSEYPYYGLGSDYKGGRLPDGTLVWYPSGQGSFYFYDFGLRDDRIGFPFYSSSGSVYTVDINDGNQPVVLSCVELLDRNFVEGEYSNAWPEGAIQLRDETLYFGLLSSEYVEQEGQPLRWVTSHRLGQLDLGNPAKPVSRDLVEIPGTFEQITDNSGGGLFIITSKYQYLNDGEGRRTDFRVQASAFDGIQAYLVDELVEEDYRYGPKLFSGPYVLLSETDYQGETYATRLKTYEWLQTGSFQFHHSLVFSGALYNLGLVDELLVGLSNGEIRFSDFKNPGVPAPSMLSFPVRYFWSPIDRIETFNRDAAYLPLGWFGVQSLDFDGAFAATGTLSQAQAVVAESNEWMPVNLELLRLTPAGQDLDGIGVLSEADLWIYADAAERLSYEEWVREALSLGESDSLPAMAEDYDGDGLSNGFEFYTGSDPGDSGDAFPIESRVTLDSDGSRHITFRLNENPSAADGMYLVPQYSDDLQNWVTAPGMFETSQEVFSTAPRVKYLEPLGVREKRFFRIIISSDN